MNEVKKHILGIDLLKIITLFSIAILHSNEFIFYEDVFPLGVASPIWYYGCYIARFFVLGGQILVALIYFLFAYTGKSKKALIKIAGFAILGQVTLGIIFDTFEWDIYAYIGVTNLILVGLPFLYRENTWVLISSIVPLLVSDKTYQAILPDSNFWSVLTGMQTDSNSGSWPMLPWFFLALLFYQVGLKVKRHGQKLSQWYPTEYYMWPIFFLLSLIHLGAYYWVPMGPHFYTFVFGQEPSVFWSNFWIYIFIMRLSFLDQIQNSLERSKLVQILSNLYWVRHLGLVYLISVIYLGIGMKFSDVFRQTPIIFDLYFVGLMPISELLGRLLIRKKAP